MERRPETSHTPEQDMERSNPNSIGELLSIGKELETRPDMVYRSVMGKGAIRDIATSGIVRNSQSAGLGYSRHGEKVFWSRGAEGKFHAIGEGYVIEAPLSIAQERVVTKEDITAIYAKDENGKVADVLKQELETEDPRKPSEARKDSGIYE